MAAAGARKDTETVVGFLIRRTGQSIFVLFLVTVATLGMVHLFPGGPVRALLGVRATPFLINYYNHLYGFDQPFYVQYLKWVWQLLQGNLGFSDKLNLSVTTLIAQDLPKTVILVTLDPHLLSRPRPGRLVRGGHSPVPALRAADEFDLGDHQ
jgi:ABC-type microcin C transport system permease subunit YejB